MRINTKKSFDKQLLILFKNILNSKTTLNANEDLHCRKKAEKHTNILTDVSRKYCAVLKSSSQGLQVQHSGSSLVLLLLLFCFIIAHDAHR